MVDNGTLAQRSEIQHNSFSIGLVHSDCASVIDEINELQHLATEERELTSTSEVQHLPGLLF